MYRRSLCLCLGIQAAVWFCVAQLQVWDSERNLITAWECLKGGCQGDGSSLFSVVPSNRTSGNRHKLSDRKLHMKKFFTAWETEHRTDCPGRLGSLLYWRYSRTAWTQSWVMCFRMTFPEQGGWTRGSLWPLPT